jgi:hypothetical protein
LDPGEILRRGRTSALEGRFEEALKDFIWFHHHALKHDRAYYGVRLSFALGYWTDLAVSYPPAMDALEAVTKRGRVELERGTGDRDLFHDIASINDNLGKNRDTYELFLTIQKNNRGLAKQCFELAVEAIVDAKDYKLAASYAPHPENLLLKLSERLNDDLNRPGVQRKTKVRRREAYVHNYCRDVRTVLKILNGLGNREAARAAREWAIALVAPKTAREMVGSQLLSIKGTRSSES